MIRRLLAPAALMLIVLAGCSMNSRYNPNNEYGDVVKSSGKDLTANLEAGTGTNAAAENSKYLAWGKALFENQDLGNNGQACQSCHPGGATTGGEATIPKKMGHGPYVLPIPSLIGAASHFPKYKVPNGEVVSLQKMDNNCIRMFMNGKRLPHNSPESIALATYVTSLSRGEAVEVSDK